MREGVKNGLLFDVVKVASKQGSETFLYNEIVLTYEWKGTDRYKFHKVKYDYLKYMSTWYKMNQ